MLGMRMRSVLTGGVQVWAGECLKELIIALFLPVHNFQLPCLVQAKRGLRFCQGETDGAINFILEQRQAQEAQKEK